MPAALAAAPAALAAALAAAAALTACSDDGTRSFDFGPFEIAAGQEIEDECVQITLGNREPLHVGAVELTAGPGFHHSNWLYVPEHVFAGPDGRFRCADRGYSEAIAAIFGGVLFAQSTQAPREVQAFPPGVAIALPPRTKIVAQLHFLNASDAPLRLAPRIAITSVPAAEVTTVLAGVSFQNEALGLPPNRASRFTVECDLAAQHRARLGRDPDFHLYYALAHYHTLGTGLTLEAVRGDGTATTVFTTANRAGDTMGGPIDPPFSMQGYARLRFSCDFENPRPEVVRWGFGDQEMCVFLAFSDSPLHWAGGVLDPEEPPGNETQVGDALHYSNPCSVLATEAR